MKKNLKNIIECQQKLHSISEKICQVFGYSSSDVKLLLVDDDYLIYYCNLFPPKDVVSDVVISALPHDCEFAVHVLDGRLCLKVSYSLYGV